MKRRDDLGEPSVTVVNAPRTCAVPARGAARVGRPALVPAPRCQQEVAIDTQQPLGEPTGAASAGSQDPSLAAWITEQQPEDAPLLAARQRAAEVGVASVDAPTGAALRMLAATVGARSVVELGTGAGVSTLWLLRGMRPDGVLTSVDSDGEHQRLAKLSLTEAGTASGRVRLISGRALEVLPRLSEGAYDLVFCDASRSETTDYLAAALPLLRPGGMVVFAGALAGGRVASPSARDADTVAARELCRAVREDPRLVPALLPVGTGLLAAVLQPA